MLPNPAPFQSWDTARKNLVDAIDHYLDMSIVLENAITHPFRQLFDNHSLEKIALAVHTDRKSVEPRNEKLKRAEFSLVKIHNRSKKLVPINSLPLELLTRFFTLACGAGCTWNSDQSIFGVATHQSQRTLLALTHVCVGWRNISIGTRSLWSHVDFIYHGPNDNGDNISNNARLWLERARDAPLSIHISMTSHYNKHMSTTFADILPHLQTASSFCIGPTRSERLLQEGLGFWLTNGAPGAVQTLSFLGADKARTRRKLHCDTTKLSRGRIDSMLAPVKVLRLHNTYFDWGSAAYCSLVHLQLASLEVDVCPTIQEMLDILSACPDLHTLKLCTMSMWDCGQTCFKPVTLRKLRVLDFTGMRPDVFGVFLPLLLPGSE
jgi:hypothetical protein